MNIVRDGYTEDSLPSHPCLKLTSNTEQVLSKFTSRRLLTFEKLTEPSTLNGMESDNCIVDFRSKYFEVREETRKERRTKKAMLREQGRLEALKRKEQVE